MSGNRKGEMHPGRKRWQRKAVPAKENADPTNCFPGQAGCLDDQRLVLRHFPIKLRHDLPGGRLKDQRAVSFGPRRPNKTLPGFDHLPGSDQHRPAGEVGRANGSRCSCSDAMERPCCDIGHGLGCGGFYRKPPGSKIEAGPGKLSALEKSIFARTDFFLGNKATGE